MLGIALADNASHALSFHDFAVLADRLDAATNFHFLPYPDALAPWKPPASNESTGWTSCGSSRVMHPGDRFDDTQGSRAHAKQNWPTGRPGELAQKWASPLF